MKRLFLPLLFVLLVGLVPAHHDVLAGGPAVESFSPEGTIKKVRQVTARFSEPMVALGDPRLPGPFDIVCPATGKGRWVDARNWAYDFDADLPAGVVCEFSLKAGLRTLSGRVLEGKRKFAFSTGGPSITGSRPYDGNKRIDEEQIFVLWLDGEPGEASVLENVYFKVEGLLDRVGVRVIGGEDRRKILGAIGGRPATLEKERPAILVQARQCFPNGAKVRLIWGKGVRSRSGVSTGEDQELSYEVRGPFRVEFSCSRENPQSGCIPVLPMEVRFTGPVAWKDASRVVLRSLDGKRQLAPESEADGMKLQVPSGRIRQPAAGQPAGDRAGDPNGMKMVSHLLFKGPFPENTSFHLHVPPQIRDDAGRKLSNAERFPLKVHTSSYPPLAKFPSRFGIIELKGGALLPVTLRNIERQVKARMIRPENRGKKAAGKGDETEQGFIPGVKGRVKRLGTDRQEQVIGWLREVANAKRTTSILSRRGAKEFSLPKPSGARAFEVIGIPLKEPGFYVVELESARLGSSLLKSKQPMYVPTSALVTNLSAHFKEGDESSLVWVTTLDRGAPVPNATVSMRDCAGKLFWKGRTGKNGIATIRGRLPKHAESCRFPGPREGLNDGDPYDDWSERWMDSGIFVFVERAKDMTFVHSSWHNGIAPYEFNLSHRDVYEDEALYERRSKIAHTVLDRPLLRAGEEVHMKHFIRKTTLHGLALSRREALPKVMTLRHAWADQEYSFDLKWDENNTAVSSWKIPREAKLGLYRIELHDKNGPGGKQGRGAPRFYSGSFRVEEFRVPLMTGVIQGPREPLVNASEAELELFVKYLAGGGAGGERVRVRTQLQRKAIQFNEYEGYTFANGAVREGAGHGSDDGSDPFGGEGEEAQPAGREGKGPQGIRSLEFVLDASGAGKAKITGLPRIARPSDIQAELEYRDPNGEIQTVAAAIPLWPSHYLVGLKPHSWAASRSSLKFQAMVLDLAGKPAAGVPVRIDLFKKTYYSHRKRLIGGFYSYQHKTEVKKIGRLAEGTTDASGVASWEVTSPVDGQVIVQAEALDGAGNASVANREIWVADEEQSWFRIGDHDRIDLLPEKRSYDPGEKARFQVRMPFRDATALVTVEREGVLDAFITRVSGKNPVVEVPIKPSYAPNVYVSVLCVRGRVAGVRPTSTVDLARPAFKLGISDIKVGWKANELKVKVSAAKDVYRVRDTVPVRVAVEKGLGGLPPAGTELAVAVVDEGLLELMPNKSWKLLDAMMAHRVYGVKTATAQMQVVGKRHFGLKAVPQGGGGGKQKTRELLDTLVFWNPRVPVDSQGEARIEIPLNDSLSTFRIVAVASGGADLFGTGEARVRTTQDVILFSGLPPLVREGDAFRAGFTVKNSSPRKMDVEIQGSMGLPAGAKEALPPLRISLAPGEGKEFGWDVKAAPGKDILEWEVRAAERGGEGQDRLKARQSVIQAVPVRTFQSTVIQIDKPQALTLERPADALPQKGGVEIALRSRLSAGMTGLTDYMRHYPYTCMEQMASRAVALQDRQAWKSVMAALPAYLDSNGLVKYFPSDRLNGSDVLTSYLLAVSSEAGWNIPSEIRLKMKTGLKRFIKGEVTISSVFPTRDLQIRKMAAIEALSREEALAPELLSSIAIEPNLWPTSAVLDWINIVKRLEAIPNREARLAEAEQVIRSRMTFQGTTLSFSTEKSDALWWLMVSADVNAVRGILTLLELENWKESMPRLVRSALLRQRRGAWNTTVANAWGVLALKKFSEKFESVPVTGTSSASMSGKTRALRWEKDRNGAALKFPWPDGRKALELRHEGKGSPWAMVRTLAAIPLKEPVASGFRIVKTVVPVIQKEKGRWSRGDVVRVRLDLTAQSDMAWVVINDPIPAGSTILGTGLGRDSRLLAKKGKTPEGSTGRVWPAFEERTFESFRAYYEYVPKGGWSVEYAARLNASGSFLLPPTRVEALYAPEVYGEIPNRVMEIR